MRKACDKNMGREFKIDSSNGVDGGRYLFMLSGAAGSGKSTLAERIFDAAPDFISPIEEICEADSYWYIRGNGEYNFNPALLPKAHEWCQNQAESYMRSGSNLIVSNTNIFSRDRKAYFDLADKYGYRVVFIHLTTQFQNVHNVPDKVVDRMRERYQKPNDWELKHIVKSDEMTEGLSDLLKKVGVDYEY